MDGTVLLVILAYTVWAIYSGHKFVIRRGWFANPGAANTVGKIAASLLIGYVIGGFTLIIGAVKLALRITDGKLF